LCRFEGPSERPREDVVGRDLDPVELDDGDALAVALLELGDAVDLDLLQLEAEPVRKGQELRPRVLAEVAADGVVQRDRRRGGYGYSPRMIVASATRSTASP
jgi:hypothetical protein